MRLSTTLSLLTAGVMVTGGLAMGQEQMPDACKVVHNLTQTTAAIGPELGANSQYLNDKSGGKVVGYGVFPTLDKHFYTSLPLGTCKLCKAARVTIRVRRAKNHFGPNGSSNDDVVIGFASPGNPPPLVSQRIWTAAEDNAQVVSKTLSFTIPAAPLNDIIFHSAVQGYLNVYIEDDTTVDSILITYYTWQ